MTIGLPENGKLRRSFVSSAEFDYRDDIFATGAIRVTAMTHVKTKAPPLFSPDVRIETTGDEITLTDYRVIGKGGPSISIQAGSGSTCDLTGSTFANITLTTSCDTVIGP